MATKRHELYQTWLNLKQRCTNPNNPGFSNYGARGICISKEWMNSFAQFISDMGERPKGFTLERIDGDGNYCKENCKWASRSEQNSNRRFKGTGVTVRTDNYHYRVRVTKEGKRLTIYDGTSFEAASVARSNWQKGQGI